jgi:hypothetical protein
VQRNRLQVQTAVKIDRRNNVPLEVSPQSTRGTDVEVSY